MNKKSLSIATGGIAAAALSGLLAGSAVADVPAAQGVSAAGSSTHLLAAAGSHSLMNTEAGKHDCKGHNECKGKGGCKTGDAGCNGKNSCKGKGGCKTN